MIPVGSVVTQTLRKDSLKMDIILNYNKATLQRNNPNASAETNFKEMVELLSALFAQEFTVLNWFQSCKAEYMQEKEQLYQQYLASFKLQAESPLAFEAFCLELANSLSSLFTLKTSLGSACSATLSLEHAVRPNHHINVRFFV